MRASIASLGNEHRLGANEAPPAIISVFLGSYVNNLLKEIEEKVSEKKMSPNEKTELKLDIGKIPEILLDNTDRNRTSPFAFTGNRFEFRAVGSSANCAGPMIVLNTAVANQLRLFKVDVDKLTKKRVKKDEAIFQVLKRYIKESKNVIFEGNGYSKDWIIEAEKKGLTNITEAHEALKAYVSDKTIALFKDCNVLSLRELESRYEISLETYTKKMQIESRVLGDLAINHIIPTAIKYQNILIQNATGLKAIYDLKDYSKLAEKTIQNIRIISEHISQIQDLVARMTDARKKANLEESYVDKSAAYATTVKPFIESVRDHIDELELIVDDELWPLPKYRELLFTR